MSLGRKETLDFMRVILILITFCLRATVVFIGSGELQANKTSIRIFNLRERTKISYLTEIFNIIQYTYGCTLFILNLILLPLVIEMNILKLHVEKLTHSFYNIR